MDIFLFSILALLIMIVSTTDYSLGNISLLKIEIDKREEKSYAFLLEKYIKKEDIYRMSLNYLKLTLVIGFIIVSVNLFSGLISDLLITGILVIIFSEAIPRLVSLYMSPTVIIWFIKIPQISYSLFSWISQVENKFLQPKHPPVQNAIRNTELELFKNALNFKEVLLKECMVPRTEICAIEISSDVDTLIKKFYDSKFSRVIIYDTNIDKIIGYVHSKDLFNNSKSIADIIRRIESFPESYSAKELLRYMTVNKISIVLVTDEYGGTAGIVTLEDIVEEIVGDINDEYDNEDLVHKTLSENEYIFSARIEMKNLNREFSLNLPESEEYETLGGFVTFVNENIPKKGDVVLFDRYQFTILKTKHNRLDLISVVMLDGVDI